MSELKRNWNGIHQRRREKKKEEKRRRRKEGNQLGKEKRRRGWRERPPPIHPDSGTTPGGTPILWANPRRLHDAQLNSK